MQLASRAWMVFGLAVVLGGYAVLLRSVLPLVGMIILGGWLLSHQARFIDVSAGLSETLSVEQTVPVETLRPDQTTEVTLAIDRGGETDLAIQATAGLPSATRGDGLSVDLPPGESTTSDTTAITWPVAGEHHFTPVTLECTDGYFIETLAAGPTPSVTVDPQSMHGIHVGIGGERVAAPYGQHRSGRPGSGFEPAGVRAYQPGDLTARIDWKATARLDEVFIREFEEETDQVTMIVFDHRHELAEGPTSTSKLELLRTVALATVGSARQFDDPLGLLTVGDGGVVTRIEPDTTAETYRAIRETLLTLGPTDPDAAPIQPDRSPVSGTRAQRHLADLAGDDSPFAGTLRPYFADRSSYLRRFERQPFYGTVRSVLAGNYSEARTVFFTDDRHRTEVEETVKLARREGLTVLVFLAPDVLFERHGLAAAEETYEAYLSFEDFRRDLSRIDGVTAFEIGPAARIGEVLAIGRQRREIPA